MALNKVESHVLKKVVGYASGRHCCILDKRDIHVFVINVDNDTADRIFDTFNDMTVNPGLPTDLVCGFKSVLRAMIANAGKYGLTFYDIWPRDIIVSDGHEELKIEIPCDTTLRPCELVETLWNINGKDSMAMYFHSEQLFSDNKWKATYDKCNDCVWMRL